MRTRLEAGVSLLLSFPALGTNVVIVVGVRVTFENQRKVASAYE